MSDMGRTYSSYVPWQNLVCFLVPEYEKQFLGCPLYAKNSDTNEARKCSNKGQ